MSSHADKAGFAVNVVSTSPRDEKYTMLSGISLGKEDTRISVKGI